MGALVARQNDVLDDRIDLIFPALAAEYAVMADARLHVMAPHIGPQARAQLVRGLGLADRADVVTLAFDREQHGASDRFRLDLAAAPEDLALRQRVFLK